MDILILMKTQMFGFLILNSLQGFLCHHIDLTESPDEVKDSLEASHSMCFSQKVLDKCSLTEWESTYS